jgi:hypothetical protein
MTEKQQRIEANAWPNPARDLAEMVLSGEYTVSDERLLEKARETLDQFPARFVVTVTGGTLSENDERRIREYLEGLRGGTPPLVIADKCVEISVDPENLGLERCDATQENS